MTALHLEAGIAACHAAGAALGLLRALEGERSLARYHLLSAVTAEFCVEVGDRARAAIEYRRALACQCSEPERQFLEGRLAEIMR